MTTERVDIDRERLLQEINRIPDDRLSEIYEILHYFRLGVGVAEGGASDAM
jgi:hypothetical protein